METKKIFCDITKCVGCKTCELACAVEHAVTKDLFLAVLEFPKPIKRIDSQFIPLEKTTDFYPVRKGIFSNGVNRWCTNSQADGGIKPPSAQTARPIRKLFSNGVKERSSLTGFIERDVYHSIGCQHCDEPPCVEACMAGCISKDKLTGKVDIDTGRCVGCWMCIMVCPFAAIARQYTKENKALKCDLCPDRDNPACVDYCPTRALSFKARELG